MHLRPFFETGLRWNIGDGRSVRFWHDNWVLPEPLSSFTSVPLSDDLSLSTVDRYIQNGAWNFDLLRDEIAPILTKDAFNQILAVHIPTNLFQDRLYWGLSTNGWFSTKSASKALHKNKNSYEFLCHWIWKLDTQPKIKHFLKMK